MNQPSRARRPVSGLCVRSARAAGPASPSRCRCFPEAAFPAGTLAASVNRCGLYLESNGIFEMVRNLVKNTDDVRHPYFTP